jgi:hypothetical protein
MRRWNVPLLFALLLPALAWAGPNPRLVLPEFPALAQKATESVVITLDPALLAMAGHFLDGNNDPQDAATKEIIKGLKGDLCQELHLRQGFRVRAGGSRRSETSAIGAGLESSGGDQKPQDAR